MTPDLTQSMGPQKREAIEAVESSPLHPCDNPFASPFSRAVSVLSAAVLILVFGSLLWTAATAPPLDRVAEPELALDLVVGRMMEAQEKRERLPIWQQWLAEWTMGSSEQQRLLAIQWYRELVEAGGDSLSRVRLAILLAEEGREQEVLAEIQLWQELPEPMPFYTQLIKAAYGLDGVEELHGEWAVEMQTTLAATLPKGWFYRTLMTRLAQRSGDDEFLIALGEQRIHEESQTWMTGLLFLELVCLILGSCALVMVVRRRSNPHFIRVAGSRMPPPWLTEVGLAVLLRGGAMGALITMAFLWGPPGDFLPIEVLAIPLANLPLLVLASVHLLKPAGLDMWKGFGLSIEPAKRRRLGVATMAVIAAGLWGEWVIGSMLELVGMSDHWTEWFDAALAWGSGSVLTVSLLEYLVFAPIFEEVAFRGLLFATLRRRWSFAPSAFVSAALFAAAHGYGVIGFLGVFWNGYLWAWIYEKTGSLLPGMIAHAANNLFVSLTVMMLLR